MEHWSVGMRRALKFRDDGGDHRFYDIDFRTMQSDPIGEIAGLYAWLDEPVTDGLRSGDAAMVGGERRANPSPVPRDPATFGLDLDQVRPLFADYVVRIEGLDCTIED